MNFHLDELLWKQRRNPYKTVTVRENHGTTIAKFLEFKPDCSEKGKQTL